MVSSLVCPACGAPYEADSNFCDQCAQPLPKRGADPSPAANKAAVSGVDPPIAKIGTRSLCLTFGGIYFIGSGILSAAMFSCGNIPVAGFLLFFCVISAAGFCYETTRLRRLRERGIIVPGEIIDWGQFMGRDGGSGWIKYTYSFNGKKLRGQKSLYYGDVYKIGHTITVVVDPDKPSSSDVLDA